MKLNDCPICKKQPKIIPSLEIEGMISIVCSSGYSYKPKELKHIVGIGPFETIDEAIKVWNGEKPFETKNK